MILSLTSFDFAHSKAVLPHTGKHSTHRELQLEFDIDTNRTKGLTEMLDDLPFQNLQPTQGLFFFSIEFSSGNLN